MKNLVKGKTYKILFAGDNYANQLLIKFASDKIVHNELFSVNNIKATMEFLRKDGKFANPELSPKPDLIILDFNQHLSNLTSLSLEIKSNAAVRSIPLVILTECYDRDVIKLFCPVADAYISKPSEIHQFFNIIHCFWHSWFSGNELSQ